jgi:Na+:H+ antiporter, NhaA family
MVIAGANADSDRVGLIELTRRGLMTAGVEAALLQPDRKCVGRAANQEIPVSRRRAHDATPPAQVAAEKVLTAIERFLHVEAVGGVVLLVAAAAALVWANSPAHESYQHFWHAPLTLGLGSYVLTKPLHFWINDGLMTLFFLLVGMEIRREIYEGALCNMRLATLPLVAALGGVAVPALIYVAINSDPALRQGWAVPTATDIAFAVGVLALLGRSIPSAVRTFLLALAIIDDIAAVLIIAVFYAAGLDYSGLVTASIGILAVLGLQQIGIGTAYAYIVPGAILWLGMLQTGVHPTLAGVALGLMTPVRSLRPGERPFDAATRALNDLHERAELPHQDPRALAQPLKQLRLAQREILAPGVRVQAALHPWVAYAVMPLFALANAGVRLSGVDFDTPAAQSIVAGVVAALVLGKPAGILIASWAAVRLGWCRLPSNVTWTGVALVGCLGGIGFTMSVFIANLAFGSESHLAAAKAGVLLASVTAAIVGLAFGWFHARRALEAQQGKADHDATPIRTE